MKNAQWENWANIALGVWLFATPWAIGHNLSSEAATMMSWNSWIAGAIVAVTAGFAILDFKPWEGWVNLVLGIYILISPFLFGYSGEQALTWNSVVIGFAVSVFSGLAIPAAQKLQRH